MKQQVVGFHQDEQGHWVAKLSCGHGQHMRHNPPWTARAWVLTEEGRAQFIGHEVECQNCEIQSGANMTSKPASGECAQIADQLRRLQEGPSWLGPSIIDILREVEEAQARLRPLEGAHTIWELVLHMTAWLRIARERLSATQTRDADEAENWPEMGASWPDAVKAHNTEVRNLEAAVLDFAGEKLHERAPAAEAQTYYQLLHGVIQHSAYHAGQIVLLKKLV